MFRILRVFKLARNAKIQNLSKNDSIIAVYFSSNGDVFAVLFYQLHRHLALRLASLGEASSEHESLSRSNNY